MLPKAPLAPGGLAIVVPALMNRGGQAAAHVSRQVDDVELSPAWTYRVLPFPSSRTCPSLPTNIPMSGVPMLGWTTAVDGIGLRLAAALVAGLAAALVAGLVLVGAGLALPVQAPTRTVIRARADIARTER